jgi:ATP/maltotriose-dependent transcriptional regulator MalT
VIDDLHELNSPAALAQLTRVLTSLPPGAHAMVTTRHDLRLGLHQLRLAGELAEIRAADLRFSQRETRLLLDAAGIALSESGVTLLHQRTEGWAAGLRLAAIALVGQPDPERFVAEFSGSDRTVAEYLLAEMLERQPADVQDLLLRTSLLDRVNGELADLLTGRSDSERILLALADANAFVLPLDPERTWFRYHHLFGDLLRLELRRTLPTVVPELHRRAAGWFIRHGRVVDAIRHTQAAGDWPAAARLLADHSFSLTLDGQSQTMLALARAFPPGEDHPELALVRAGGDLVVWLGEFDEGERWLQRTAVALQTDTGPDISLLLHHTTGILHACRGQRQQALEEFSAAERLGSKLEGSHALAGQVTGWRLATLARLGRPGDARASLATVDDERAGSGELLNAYAVICLAEGEPVAALGAVQPVLDGTAPVIGYVTVVEAWLLAGLAQREVGDRRAANQAAERALALAEADRLVLPFAMTFSGELLEALPWHETAHAALLADILDALHGSSPVQGDQRPPPDAEELSPGELRVLRYLPTNLSRPEIAGELSVSVNTVSTHVRSIYAKLQVSDRSSAVQRARELRLLAVGRTP